MMDTYIDSTLLPAVAAAPISFRDSHCIKEGLYTAIRNISSGLVAQFGVYKGKSLKTMSTICNTSCHIFAFDSFEGLPEKWRNGKHPNFEHSYTAKGAFDMRGQVPRLGLKNVAFTVGLFADTLPSFLASTAYSKASFLHIDADLYSSTRDVLCSFQNKSMLTVGTVIVFDELLGYPEYRSGEVRALYECVVARGHRVRILQRGIKKVSTNYTVETWPQSVALQLV